MKILVQPTDPPKLEERSFSVNYALITKYDYIVGLFQGIEAARHAEVAWNTCRVGTWDPVTVREVKE